MPKNTDHLWKASSPEQNELFCVYDKGVKVGLIQTQSKCARMINIGEMPHPDLKDHLLLEKDQKLATASADGLVKIWDLTSCSCTNEFTVDDFVIFLAAQQGVITIQTKKPTSEGAISSVVCRTTNGNLLPQQLEEKLTSAHFWITLSDRAHVVGSRDCQFVILSKDGIMKGCFSHDSVQAIIPFLDHFIATAARGVDLKIWSETGQELFSQHLGHSRPNIVSDEHARIVALDDIDGSFHNTIVFDFGASKNEIEDNQGGQCSKCWLID